MPVKVATSESVKIFWLDFTVTMAVSFALRPLPSTMLSEA
jgi:hypothetical protein